MAEELRDDQEALRAGSDDQRRVTEQMHHSVREFDRMQRRYEQLRRRSLSFERDR